MRWDRLFADLEAELAAADAAELEAEIAERTRSERAKLRLVDRIRGSVGHSVQVRVNGAGQFAAEIRAVGADWVLVRPVDGADRLVPIAALLDLSGLAASSAGAETGGVVAARFSLAAVLRGLARDRAIATITLVDGSSRTGTIEVAGADLVEISDRRHDEPGFAALPSAAGRRCVPLAAIAVVREH